LHYKAVVFGPISKFYTKRFDILKIAFTVPRIKHAPPATRRFYMFARFGCMGCVSFDFLAEND
jgi:hypothetical protein